MANILLLDDSEVAGQAMQGILARGHHGCVIAKDCGEAIARLREAVVIDLIFVEPNLAQNEGFNFLQRLREDCFWKNLPVVVYSTAAEPAQVRKALALKVHGYLIKPYRDTVIHEAIAKAIGNPWRSLHFEEPRSFCAQMGITPDALVAMRRDLMGRLDTAANELPRWATERDNAAAFARLDALTEEATAAGVWAVVDYVTELRGQAEADNWSAFAHCDERFSYASRLIFHQLNPTYLPECLRSREAVELERQAAERARWISADVDANGPVMSVDVVKKQVAALGGCPVIDTAAASFLMTADGRAQSMSAIMELASSDPGLCAQVLIAANKLDGDEMSHAEDPETAVSLLGVIKLNTIARNLLTIPERHMRSVPITWANFWLFQVAVGKVAQFICDYLEFPYLRSKAYTAGLMHDIGKLALVRLHPFGFHAIVSYAQQKKLPLHEAERRYIGCSTRELGALLAEANGLPPIFSHVIRWVETPEEATEHIDLVAMISLARFVCLHNHVGYCGDTPHDACPPIAQTSAWRVLQPRLFPSFDLAKFEAQAHAYCLDVRHELLGRNRIAPRTDARAVA